MKYIWDTEDIRRNTLLSTEALFTLYEEAKSVHHIAGNAAEVGVYRGGSAVCIASALPNKIIHAFESFAGLSCLNSKKDCIRAHKNMRGHSEGDFRLDNPNAVRLLLKKHSIVLHEGEFFVTCESVKKECFSFAHCDVDTYKATYKCLRFFYPRLMSGGKMLVHDYGWLATPGVKHAVDEFLRNKHEQVITRKGNYALIVKD